MYKGFSLLLFATVSFVPTAPIYAQNLDGNLPSVEYCREYREQTAASANAGSSANSTNVSGSGYGGPGFGGGSASYGETNSRSNQSSRASQRRFERSCDQLLKSAGEVTIEQVRAKAQVGIAREGGKSDRYSACVQAASSTRLDSFQSQQQMLGCSCVAQGMVPHFDYASHFDGCH